MGLRATSILILYLFAISSKQSKAEQKTNPCIDHKTCGACIQAGQDCGWCTQENVARWGPLHTCLKDFRWTSCISVLYGGWNFHDANQARCDLINNLRSARCEDRYIIEPRPNTTFTINVPVQDAKDGSSAIQLAPQQIDITIRPRTPYKFNVTFKQAANYPVDLYYVMDLSQSMSDDKDNLAGLGDKIAEDMKTITKNFRLGFGSFVDKKTLPYVSTVPDKLLRPCTGCVSPYGFYNQMKLTDDTPEFKRNVMASNISGNLDSPEGGFDAIMQAISCKNEIGWREHSRKMLVYSSDAAFHYAGDGKLGGIVTPNDGNCHMDSQGYYTESLNQDYPSVSQLANKIAEKKVNVIFAVTDTQVALYQALSQHIEGSTVGGLASDSSNIVKLIRDNYEKITSAVELKTEGADGVQVTFRSRCLGMEMKDTPICANLTIGDNVTYEVTIEVEECPPSRSLWSKSLKIYPVGLTEALRVNLNLVCECNCELPTFEEKNSAKCNSSGTFECGACTCNENRYGRTCECDKTSLESEDYNTQCRKSNTSEVCEGRGHCLCGSCACNPITPGDPSQRYSGKFCECDDYSCDRYDGKLCGGSERGSCHCGVCRCNSKYNGTSCECPVSEEACLATNKQLCNGKGVCKCGRCTCNVETYRGRTCEDCPTCVGKCDQNKECVQCSAFQSGSISKEECEKRCNFVSMVDHLEDTEGRKTCQYRDDDGCMLYFAYAYDSEQVWAQRTKECPKPVNVLAIVLGVVLGIVAVGIVLLFIWKIVTHILDKREWAKFEKEKKSAKWDTGENPIYKQATSTFQNPAYGGK